MIDTSNIKALTFDCYGTLIDWEAGLLRVLRPWADEHALKAGDDDLLVAFADAESLSEQEAPRSRYTDILRRVHREMCECFGATYSDTEAERLAMSVGDWPVFEDTPGALQRLKKHYKLVIVSNVDHASFARTQPKLGVEFDAVVTAEDVGAYKPDHAMFRGAFEAVQKLGATKDQILHVAQSLHHDHAPAKELGLRTAWVDRRQGRDGGATPTPSVEVKPDLVVRSLYELATELGA